MKGKTPKQAQVPISVCVLQTFIYIVRYYLSFFELPPYFSIFLLLTSFSFSCLFEGRFLVEKKLNFFLCAFFLQKKSKKIQGNLRFCMKIQK